MWFHVNCFETLPSVHKMRRDHSVTIKEIHRNALVADQTTRAEYAACEIADAMETIHKAGGDITTIGARIWNALDIRTREYLREIVPNA